MIELQISPQRMTITELIEEARREIALFQHRQAMESACSYELWRRAIVLRDDWAWSAVYGLYAPVVSAWIVLRIPGLVGEDLDALVNQAFARFAHAMTEQKWRDFARLGALLDYLKRCHQSTATDYHRWQPRRHEALDSLPASCEPLLSDCADIVIERLAAQELWHLVCGQAPAHEELLVLLLVVAQGMSPRALQQRYPAIYPTVEDIYRIRVAAFSHGYSATRSCASFTPVSHRGGRSDMQAKLYASNYQQRREEIFARANGRCENILPGGERCSVKLGDWRVTRSRQLQFEQLIIHHPDDDPENPNARMLAICWACHMRLHRQPGPGRPKACARKQGYEVIRVPHLMELLATRAGFSTWSMFDGRVRWQIGTLTGEANDSIGALMMALHWLVGEIRDLQSQLDQLQENTMSTPMFRPAPHQREHDIALQLQDAEQRRACDQFLRQSPVRSTWIANDATVLLNAILDQAPANTAVEVSTAGQGAGVQESMCDITGGQRAKSASPAGVTRQKRKEAMLNRQNTRAAIASGRSSVSRHVDQEACI